MTHLDSLGFGGDSITSVKSYRNALKILDIAFEMGIRHFDTAPIYGKGYSEIIFGRFLKNKRSEVTITTKFGYPNTPKLKNIPVEILLPANYWVKHFRNKITKSAIQNSQSYRPIPARVINKKIIEIDFYQSLKSLQTDYLDFYLLHEGLPAFLTYEAVLFLFDLQKQGFIKKIGLGSNFQDIGNIPTDAINEWSVLQYEGHDDHAVRNIMTKFPNHLHFHHGCIKGVSIDQNMKDDSKWHVGRLLAEKAINNPKGKVIFSSTNPKNIKDNTEGFLNFTVKSQL